MAEREAELRAVSSQPQPLTHPLGGIPRDSLVDSLVERQIQRYLLLSSCVLRRRFIYLSRKMDHIRKIQLPFRDVYPI
jgi:hypothetical protein